MKPKLNTDVVCALARKVAEASNVFESDDEHKDFDRDPELWVIGLLLAALEHVQEKSSTSIKSVVREASYEDKQEEAWKLLKRKGRFEPMIKEMSST